MSEEEKKAPKGGTTVLLQPEDKTLIFPYQRSVQQLLNTLEIRRNTTLVIRNGKLLTPDSPLDFGDHITIRRVTSAG